MDDLTLTTDECNGNDSNQPFAVDASNCVSTTTTKISIAPTCTLDKEIFETMKAKEKMVILSFALIPSYRSPTLSRLQFFGKNLLI